ncbi:hypothetical protein CRUP_018717 [Coryphaenoides rupestris]|nr:hypothetical protein CRUP_018717 [Coryphaenoides rupestris]
MFPPRRPVCELGVAAARLHRSGAVRRTHAAGTQRVSPPGAGGLAGGLGALGGLLLSYLQRAAGPWVREGSRTPGLLSLLADHCGFVTAQRLRRALRVGELYSNLYSERTRWALVGHFWRRLRSQQGAPAGRLLAALAGVFMWDHQKVEDEEIRSGFVV